MDPSSFLQPVLTIYGGGQIPDANFVMGSLIENLINKNCIVYGVKNSFFGLISLDNYERVSIEKAQYIKEQYGTYFKTCRKFNPTDSKYLSRIIGNLEELNIHTIFVCGGDGSLRAISAFKEKCDEVEFKIKVIFIPCTIDGMNGTKTLGFEPCVQKSITDVNFVCCNAFATYDCDYRKIRTAIIEVQGRNRNDILISVINHVKQNGIGGYPIEKVNLICIPAGYAWDIESVIDKINSSNKPAAIICSEGTHPTDLLWNVIPMEYASQKLQITLESKNVKSNCHVIGYLSQTNDCISDIEKQEAISWINLASSMVLFKEGDSYAIVKNNGLELYPMDELTKQNLDDKFVKLLTDDELEIVEEFLP